MIQLSELRIGNLVNDINLGETTIISISINGVSNTITGVRNTTNISYIEGIELTPEWLKRMGGKNENNPDICELIIRTDEVHITVAIYKGKVALSLEDNETEDYINFPDRKMFVHELQNWVFALTGSELEAKQLDRIETINE